MAKKPYQRSEDDHYRAWIKDAIERSDGRLNQAGLARHLGLDRSQISHILSKKRAIRAGELEAISAYLGEPPPGGGVSSPSPLGSSTKARVIGRLGKSHWHDTAEDYVDRNLQSVDVLPDEAYPTAEQFAWPVDKPSKTKLLMASDIAVGLPLSTARAALRVGAMVITRRERTMVERGHKTTLENWTLAEIASIKSDGSYVLAPVLDDEKTADLGTPTHWVRQFVRKLP